jgi:uncharacterized membrane protein HdeD (DUF308 family)
MANTVAANIQGLDKDARAYCKRTWWVFLIGGIASVLFGVLAYMKPGSALFVLAMYFAAFVLVDGAMNIWGSLTNRDRDGWWISLLLGLVAVGIGIFALLNPPVTMVAFIYLVAFMAIATGISLILLGWRVRQVSNKEWLLYVIGALSLIFGGIILFQPAEGAQSVVVFIASWAILIGALRIYFAFKARSAVEDVKDGVREKIAPKS